MIKRAYKKWIPKEIDYLKNNIGKKSYREIAITLNRNRKSVKHKAERIGLKSPNFIRKKEIISRNDPCIFDINDFENYFLAGFVAGEGCFTTAKSKPGVAIFQIHMSADDSKILHRFKEKIKCGYITFYKKRNKKWKDETILRISSHYDIHTRIIPFFKTYLLEYTHKYQQFADWVQKYYGELV